MPTGLYVGSATDEWHTCSRTENPELFSLAIGGYGLFGVITEATLRLVPRHKVERTVKVIPIRDLMENVESRIKEGFVFGDCQYNTDTSSDDPHAGDSEHSHQRKTAAAPEGGPPQGHGEPGQSPRRPPAPTASRNSQASVAPLRS